LVLVSSPHMPVQQFTRQVPEMQASSAVQGMPGASWAVQPLAEQ
jgi:hypothetical protein